MKTAAIVQARLFSKRLPCKILLPLQTGRLVIEEVLYRCRLIKGIDMVVCAVADDEGSDIVAQCIHWMTSDAFGDMAVRIIRGPQNDVLARYLRAAEEVQADVILRVTSDCPLIDPRVCEQVLAARVEFNYDYACNNNPATYAKGLDCEAFTLEALRKADAVKDPANREHVTEWLRSAPEINRYNLARNGARQDHIRWTLDTADDYVVIRKRFDELLAAGEAL